MATAMSGGSAQRRVEKDKARARYMKQHGIERTTGVCAACYRTIRIDSIYGRYNHVCSGGR